MSYFPSDLSIPGLATPLNGVDTVPISQNGKPCLATFAAVRAFLLGTAAVPTLAVATPTAKVAGAAFALTGTYANAVLTALDVSLDGGATWQAATAPAIGNGAFSVSVTIAAANSAQTVRVRDRANTGVTATTGLFSVAAAAALAESDQGISVTGTTGQVVDADRAVWTLVHATLGGLGLARNGAYIDPTANVTLLLYYSHRVYQQNSFGLWYLWTGTTFVDSADPRPAASTTPGGGTATPSGGTGPVATSSFLTVDFGAPTGYPAPATLWGVGAAAPNNDHFRPCADPTFLNAAAQIMPSLYRVNCNSGYGGAGISETGYWSRDIFVNGINNPNWNVTKNFTDNGYRFIDANCRLIIGLMFANPDNTLAAGAYSVAEYASVCTQVAQHFKTTKGLDGKPLNVWGWEVGNETDGHVSDADYNRYFNAAADAFHAVDPNYKIIGPVHSYVANYPDGGLQSWGATCGTKNVVACYHGYRYGFTGGNLISDADLFTGTRSRDDATTCRRSLAGTPAANCDVMMGEYNIDYNASSEPHQQKVIGATFVAKWIIDALKSHQGVTMGALWEMSGDNTYGVIQGGSIDAQGWLLSKAGKVMGGAEVASSFAAGGSHACLPVVNGSKIGVMIVNYDLSAAITGQVALSRWPLGASGTGTISKWEISAAQPSGAVTSLAVTAGLTASITVPATSVVILYA